MTTLYQDELLEQHLRAFLGDIDAEAIALLRKHLEWIAVAAGQTLMVQGEAGDSMYLSISGRLKVYVVDDAGVEHMVREMARGQVIGEMSLYTDEPRSATVIAVRDSVLVRLAKADFNRLVASSSQLSIALTRQIIKRLQSAQKRSTAAKPVTLAIFPVTTGIELDEFAASLAVQLQKIGRVRIVDTASIDSDLQETGLAQSAADNVEAKKRIALYLDRIEAAHDFVILVGDPEPTPWTQRCAGACDEMLLLADALQPPVLHEIELKCLAQRPGRAGATETLVLLHPPELRCPIGTRAWLDRRPVSGHVHLRRGLEKDMARLARLQSGTAIGLVMAGGGARGCAHLGIYRALQEHGIEIDVVGGTSIGAIMATLVASDRTLEEVLAIARRAFAINPTGDFNFIPLLSLIAGRRLRKLVQTATFELLGRKADVEDLWKNCFVVASNYSQASEQVILRGDLGKAISASIAIPGALPPVLHDGDLLCDGGTFNNFPVDVMRRMPGVGKVIGVDLSFGKVRRIDHDEVPGSWALLRDRLRPRAKRRFRFPSLVSYLMNVTILYSKSRQIESKKLTDLYFNPPLLRVGMLEWKKFDSIVNQGHAHGREVLSALSAAEAMTFKPMSAERVNDHAVLPAAQSF